MAELFARGLRLLQTKALQNRALFERYCAAGVDYLLNPNTKELHKVKGGCLDGSHNLKSANLDEFFWLFNLGDPIHNYPEGTLFTILDIIEWKTFVCKLNLCKHCFPY